MWILMSGLGYCIPREINRKKFPFIPIFAPKTPQNRSVVSMLLVCLHGNNCITRSDGGRIMCFMPSHFFSYVCVLPPLLLLTCTWKCHWMYIVICEFWHKFMIWWLPSVLWRCWLGGRKGIRPVKTEWRGTSVVICLDRGANDLHIVQLMLLPPHHRLIQIGLPFWCWLTQVVLERRLLNGCSSISSSWRYDTRIHWQCCVTICIIVRFALCGHCKSLLQVNRWD